MTDYHAYNYEELALDPYFRQWILAPDRETNTFWEIWQQTHPGRIVKVAKARALVLEINQVYNDNLSEQVLKDNIDELVRQAGHRNDSNRPTIKAIWNLVWRVAAAFVLISGFSLYYFRHRPASAILSAISADDEKTTEMLVKINDSGKEMTVLLSDNSVATLMNGSKLTYPEEFGAEHRQVFLSGEAFFDITKNPRKPFLVYANGTVTKVLGTSFRVKAFDQEPTVMVVVKTGRVSVYPEKEFETLSQDGDREITGVILNPNQQVVFKKKDYRLEKGIVANPGMLKVTADQGEMVFDEQHVSAVLQTIANVYGIDIVFDPEMLASCQISAQFSEETLKQRMNAICQAIGATYEMVDGQIIVNSKGCN